MQCLWLYHTFTLMREVTRKRAELRARSKNSKKSDDGASDETATASDEAATTATGSATRRTAAKKKEASHD